MKTVSTRDLQIKISAFLQTAQNEPVVVTKHGNPAAIIEGVEGMSWDEVIEMLGKKHQKKDKKR